MATPPPPPGFQLQSPKKGGMFAQPKRNPDLLKPLLDAGIEPTSGYRTPADIERLRSSGYKPATNSLHLKGDAVDLTPGKSGMSLRDIEERARSVAGSWPGAKIIRKGDHVHVQLPGWGMAPGTPGTPNSGLPELPGWGMAPGTPGTPNSGLPELPQGFTLQQRGSLQQGNWTPGKVADGDTFALPDGRNARISGLDAYELGQQGRSPSGALVPLGQNSRATLMDALSGKPAVSFGGTDPYGRPLVSLTNNGMDEGLRLLRGGDALAAPEYLKRDPRFAAYMEAERRARQNLLGGHGTNAETPKEYRDKSGPWAAAEPGEYGKGIAVFNDERTPFQGLRPEIEQGYVQLSMKPGVTAAELMAYAKDNGFTIREDDAERFIKVRDSGAKITPKVVYEEAPKPITNQGDGAMGSYLRGFADPINMLDEAGAVIDTLGGTGGRENLWNSERRFGDILWNNIDQNRSILAYDDANHPLARIGGQLTSGVLLPLSGPARTPLGLARVGAVEGGLAGFGAGEGGVFDRLPNAAGGAILGTAGGYALGRVADDIGRGFNVVGPRPAPVAREVGFEAAPIVNSGAQNAGPTPAARSQPAGGTIQRAAMTDEAGSPSLVGEAVSDAPPPPPGFVADAPFGVSRPMGSPLTAPEIARLGEGVDPRSVIARPSNEVGSMEEALKADPGRFRLTQEPDPSAGLEVRFVNSGRGGTVRMRGPLDISQTLRSYGGVKDTGGDLRHSGITNAPRKMDWGSNEQFLGRLINNDDGMALDQAAVRLYEEGYFDHVPDVDELKDALRAEANGHQRYFRRDDMNEAAAFDDAANEASFLRSAAQRGAPYVDDVTEEITLDDLSAMQPPASAYEDAPRLTGRVGNINLARLENPGDVAQLIDQVSKRVGGFDPAKRGKITQDETRLLATELGLKPEQLLKRVQGQALNAEQLYAVRVLAQKSREVVAKLAQKAVNTSSDEDLLAFRKAWVRHVAIEEQVAGATAEAGRALAQFRMLAKAGDARGAAVKAYLKGAGGRENIEDAAQAIVDLIEDPAKASHFMREGLKPTWTDKFNELWVNSLLSGPRTHVVNFVGNALTTLYSLPEQALTAGIGAVTRSSDRALGREVGARIVGLANSSVEGLRNARQAFITGEPLDAVSKVEANNYRAISGLKGEVIRLPTRALTAADEFWKTINRNAELHALAYRRAATEAATPAERKARYEALLRSPDESMVKAADAAARYYTFQKELGEAGQSIQRFANKAPGAKILIPFVRTPINLLKFAGERSILGPALMPSVRQALKAGGRARDEALAKITLGSGLSTAAVLGAMDGKVTGGGPTDRGERLALLQSGWQPYSIKVGDQWVSYQRFDPLSTVFGAAADFAEVGRYARPGEADKFALHLAQAIAKNITNKTWLSGLSDAFDVLSDPQRYGEGYVQRLAGSLAVPAVAGQAAQALDPNMREVRSILDAIKARVPVISEGLPVRRDIWGEEMKRGDAVGPDMVSPVFSATINGSPMRQEIARLRVPLSMPKRTVTIAGQKVELNAEQYDRLLQLSGKPARTYLEGYIGSAEYKAMSDPERVEAIREIMKDFRKSGLDAVKGLYPELGGNLSPGDIKPLPQGFRVQGQERSRGVAQRVVPGSGTGSAPPPGFVLDGGR